MYVQTVLLLTMALLCAAQNTTSDTEQTNGAGDWLAALEKLLQVGNVFSAALDAFEKWNNWERGNAMITVENYSNDTILSSTVYHKEAGNIDQFMFDVGHGEKQAISTSGALFGRAEGMAGWSLPNTELKVVVYWRVPTKLSKDPNKLGLGFVHGSRSNTWLSDMVASSLDSVLRNIGMQEYGADGAVLQCCREGLCLQGIMTTSNHCNVSVRILPRDADRLFQHVGDPAEDQQSLNQQLNQRSRCYSTSADSVRSDATLALLLLMTLVLWL